jgi:hypothetical protein
VSRPTVDSSTIGAGFGLTIAGISNGLAGIGLIDDRRHKQYLGLEFRGTCTVRS